MTNIHLGKVDLATGSVRSIEMVLRRDLLGWVTLFMTWRLDRQVRFERMRAFPTEREARAALAEMTLSRVQRGFGPMSRLRKPLADYSSIRADARVGHRLANDRNRLTMNAIAAHVSSAPKQLELDLAVFPEHDWAGDILRASFENPSLAERIYGPSLQAILARIVGFRSLDSVATDDGKVTRLVPRGLRPFLASSLESFFPLRLRLANDLEVLRAAGFSTVGDLIQTNKSALKRLGLSERSIISIRGELRATGLDLGCELPPTTVRRRA